MGIERVLAESSLIGFLDDDLVLEYDAVEKMLSFWETAENEVGGAGFNITNTAPNKGIFAKSFVGIETKERGAVLSSGFNTQFCPVKNTFSVQWLCGGATVWRKEVLEKYKFDEQFKSYGYYEDVEFSYRAAKKYSLFMISDAKVKHLHTKSKVKFEKYYFLERIISKGRVYFVKKNPELSIFLCFLATLMQTAIYFIKGTLSFNSEFFARGAGNFMGFIESVGDKVILEGQNG
jgi:GT2 family glycosyltransferase